MNAHDGLGDRMKRYEAIPKLALMRKTPVIVRVDGKAFHTLTKHLEKPVDQRFADCMTETAKYLCDHTPGCQLAYVQSDEISLLLHDYETVYTEPYFGNDQQKLVTTTAAQASVAFCAAHMIALGAPPTKDLPTFDSRAFNLPREEVCNYFIWRQQDATRNSIQSLARAHFSHHSLQGLTSEQLQGKLLKEKGINWNNCPTPQKRGVCLIRWEVTQTDDTSLFPGAPVTRHVWQVDRDIPVFTADRGYVNHLVYPELVAVNEGPWPCHHKEEP